MFFFHHELSSCALLSLLSKFQEFSPCSFLSRGRFIPILAHFLKISLKNMEAFITQKRIQIHSFLIKNYLLMLCLVYYQNFKRFHHIVFLVEGALYQFWHISKDFAHEYWSLHCGKKNLIAFSFFFINYILMLCLVYYQNFKRFHFVVFLVKGALFPFWHIFWRFRSKIWRPSLCKNEFDIFFFHPELSSYAIFSLLSKHQKISPYSFVSRWRFIPSLAHFLKNSLTKIEAFIVQKRIRWFVLFHHELSSCALLSLLSKFQKFSSWSFLSRGRFIPILAHFLKIWLKNMETLIVQKRIQWYFLFSSWIIFLCYAYSTIKISKDFTVKFC